MTVARIRKRLNAKTDKNGLSNLLLSDRDIVLMMTMLLDVESLAAFAFSNKKTLSLVKHWTRDTRCRGMLRDVLVLSEKHHAIKTLLPDIRSNISQLIIQKKKENRSNLFSGLGAGFLCLFVLFCIAMLPREVDCNSLERPFEVLMCKNSRQTGNTGTGLTVVGFIASWFYVMNCFIGECAELDSRHFLISDLEPRNKNTLLVLLPEINHPKLPNESFINRNLGKILKDFDLQLPKFHALIESKAKPLSLFYQQRESKTPRLKEASTNLKKMI